jgi:hypothetical protein
MMIMIREIIRKIVLLLVKPEVAWTEFVNEPDAKQLAIRKFSYPLMGAAALALLLSQIIFHHYPVHVLVIHAVVYFVSLFAALHISMYILGILMRKRYNFPLSDEQKTVVTVYSFTVIFVLHIATALFPGLFFLWIFALYTPYLLWTAAEEVFGLKPEERGFLVLGASASVILSPLVVRIIINILMPHLQ